MAFAGVKPGMSIADIGAGEGYYTVRLSPIVGPTGRVLAQDIVPATRDKLAQRVDRDKLDNVFRPARPARRSAHSGGIVRPHLPGPHVS